MRSNQELPRLKEQAIALRRAGKSRRQIKEILGIVSNATLDRALRGVPPPEWTRRPRAKDPVRARARELREKGLDLEEIAAELGVSKGSVSVWVRDMPRPLHLSYEESRKRSAEGVRRYWAAEAPVREAARQAVIAAAAARAAERFWLEVTGADRAQFRTTTLKRHNPKTVRKNVGEDYHGCRRMEVTRSAELYQRIAGWAQKVTSARADR
jgi:transcriptional regulator with XRE-family HTH domain